MTADNTIKLLEDLSNVLIQAIGAWKSRNYFAAISLLTQAGCLVPEARAALAEYSELEPSDYPEICEAAYKAIAKILASY